VSTVRRAAAGATRTCPHCRTVILQSAAVCPACKKHLRFDPSRATTIVGAEASAPSFSALRVEGAIKHPGTGEAWEYSVVISIKNDRGDEVARQVVGVGALQPGEGRTFSFSVDVFTPD
jgi:RNA polymerase subunit RPABC4/transcription elongation factor Spt4